MRLWIKDPLAILAPAPSAASSSRALKSSNASRAADRRPLALDATFNASRHVVLPGLVNAHHHFYQTLTRAHPDGFGKELIPWLVAMERVWGRMTPEALQHRGQDGAGRTDALRLHDRRRPSQSLSARPGERHRHRSRRGDEARPADDGDARLDGHFREGRRPAAGLDRAGFGHDPRGQRARAAAVSRSEPRRDDPRRARALLAARRAEAGDGRIGGSAERYDARLHCHLCQSPDEDVYAVRRSACDRSISWRRPAGSHSRTWVAHGIHFNAGEIERLGRAGVGVCHCAASDMAFGMGVCPVEGARGGGRRDRARRRRLGVERFVEHDGGGAPFADAPAADATGRRR